jgi:hypothetical protein
MDAQYLRKQAERCARLGHQCWDLAIARKLSEIANEYRLKAQEIDQTEAEASLAPIRARSTPVHLLTQLEDSARSECSSYRGETTRDDAS